MNVQQPENTTTLINMDKAIEMNFTVMENKTPVEVTARIAVIEPALAASLTTQIQEIRNAQYVITTVRPAVEQALTDTIAARDKTKQYETTAATEAAEAKKSENAAADSKVRVLNAESSVNADAAQVAADKARVSTLTGQTIQAATAVSTDKQTVETARDTTLLARNEAKTSASAAKGSETSAMLAASRAEAASLEAVTVATQALIFKGGWDASTGVFPTADPLRVGFLWKVTNTGTLNNITYRAGDSVIYNGSDWDHIDNTESVVSVNGKTGAVHITKNDVGLENVRNVASYSTQELDDAAALKADKNDPRFTDKRDWWQSIVSRTEAETGTSTVPRKWNSLRVRQAINAALSLISNATQAMSGWMSASDKTKLDGITAQATKNDTDANLLNRQHHTGTQDIATVDGLRAELDAKLSASLRSGTVLSDSQQTVATSGAVKRTWDHATNAYQRANAAYSLATTHTHTAEDLPGASTSAKGVVQLSSSTSSTSEDEAATSKAVNDLQIAVNTEKLGKAEKAADSWKLDGITADGFAQLDRPDDGSQHLILESAQYAYLSIKDSGKVCWNIGKAPNRSFFVNRFDTNGDYIDTPFRIDSNGTVTVNGSRALSEADISTSVAGVRTNVVASESAVGAAWNRAGNNTSHVHSPAQIGVAMAGQGASQIGVPILLWDTLARSVGPGGLVAGHELRYASTYADDDDFTAVGHSNIAPPGTWECCGYSGIRGGSNNTSIACRTTLWKRRY